MQDFVENNKFTYDDFPLFEVDIDKDNNVGTIYLKNNCSWMSNSYGCTMCNYSCREHVVANDVIKEHLDEIIGQISIYKLKHIKIYMNGSFFCDQELDFHNRYLLLSRLQQQCNVNSFTVESRFDCIDKKKLYDLVQSLPQIKLDIALGLESTNDKILKYAINKGTSFSQFKKVYREIKDIVNIKVYLLFKPPFLTELEAIEDMVSSIRDLINIGVSRITITPLSVQNQTLTKFLLEEHLYRPLWLWSIIELNTRIKRMNLKNTNIKIAGFQHLPVPVSTPFNCEKCSDFYSNKINSFKLFDWDDVGEKCDCYNEWLSEINKEERKTIEERYEEACLIQQKSISRTKDIAYKLETNFKNFQLSDIAKQVPTINSKLDFVGVEHVPVRFFLDHKKDRIPFLGECLLSVSLDEFHRGIHMSRLLNSIDDFCNDNHTDLLCDIHSFLQTTAKAQHSKVCKFQIHTDFFTELYSDISKKKSIVKIPMIITSMFANEKSHNTITVKFDICNACPCTKSTNLELFDNINSHTQRGSVELTISNWEGDLMELLKWCSEHYMLRGLLKREDEIYLVNNIYSTPLFCEDICRNISKEFESVFKNNYENVITKIVTEESIHPHNAFAIKYSDSY